MVFRRFKTFTLQIFLNKAQKQFCQVMKKLTALVKAKGSKTYCEKLIVPRFERPSDVINNLGSTVVERFFWTAKTWHYARYISAQEV